MHPSTTEIVPKPASAQAAELVVSPRDVRARLERVLACSALRDSELLKRFLRYAVEQTLEGKGDQLKEYRLGIDVFERPASFDPRLDPTVRVAARRMRKKLEEYYKQDGRLDSIRIEIPKGGYAARFTTVSPELADAEHAMARPQEEIEADSLKTGSRVPRTGKPTRAAGAAVVLVLLSAALIAGGVYYRSRQTGRLTDTDSIVLADFANSTGDPVFDDTLKTALSISLQQSPFLNVVSEQKIATTLQMMTRPVSAKVTSEVAREVCQRSGSKAYIAGAIASLGSDYVLALKAVNCQSGDTLAQQQVTAASKEKVLDALGKAASRLRGELGESLATVQRFDVPLEDATTPSLEALKAYSEGRKADKEKGNAGLPYDQHAIELDPSFAVAYEAVGGDYSNLGEQGRADEYITRAFQLRAHASEWEKLKITADYYLNVTGELDKAASTCQEQIASYPLRSAAYNNLGLVYALQGQYAKAAASARENIQLMPVRAGSYGNLANDAIALQQFDESRQIIHEAQARKMDHSVFHSILYALAFLAGDSREMAEQQQWFAGKADYECWGLALASDT